VRAEVRALERSEVALCLPMGGRFFAEAKLPGEWSDAAFLGQWQSFYDLGFGRIFGAMNGAGLVGVCGGLVAPDTNTGQRRATELFWWLDPEHRRGSLALRLMRAFEEWAEAEGCEAVSFAFIHGTGREEVLDRWYRRRGYRPLETHYVKVLD
jgi:GNAT superfamily N-acetyltransferase